MNGGGIDDDGDDSEPKAKAKPRAKKSKTNADGEEKKPRAPGKPVRSVSVCVWHIQSGIAVRQPSASRQHKLCKHFMLLHMMVLSTLHHIPSVSFDIGSSCHVENVFAPAS